MREFQINGNEAGQRLDKYLKKLLAQAPSGFIYKMLRKKNITLNGKKASGAEQLSVGDAVMLFLSEETFLKFAEKKKSSEAYEMLRRLKPLPVIYEDDDILIVNKPSGLLSQKASPSDISANEHILGYLLREGALTEEMLATFQPSICNRLDRNTSGLLTAGKTLKGLQELSLAFKERTVQKYYRCIIKGELRESSHLKGWLWKDEVKNQVQIFKTMPAHEDGARILPLETEYLPVKTAEGYTELEVHLITGRSHQIRAHLASIGHPIIGDSKYGDRGLNAKLGKEASIHSQLLHAYCMVFFDGKKITAPCGAEFERFWNYVDHSVLYHSHFV